MPAEQSVTEFPPHVLREYALPADGERGVLVGPGGDFAWMCAPRWDSDARPLHQAFVHALLLESAHRLAAPWTTR